MQQRWIPLIQSQGMKISCCWEMEQSKLSKLSRLTLQKEQHQQHQVVDLLISLLWMKILKIMLMATIFLMGIKQISQSELTINYLI